MNTNPKVPGLWLGLAIAFLAVASFPAGFSTPSAGLDPSWNWALNTLSQTGAVFGRDVAFTYGPLGFLVVPQDVGNNIWLAFAFRLVLQGVLASALFALLREAPKATAALTLALQVSVLALFPDFEAHIFVVVAALAVAIERVRSVWLAGVAGALLPFLLLTKTTIGIMAGVLVGAALVQWFFTSRRTATRAIFAVVATSGLGLVTLGVGFFDSPASVWRWLAMSSEFADGYSAAMVVFGHRRDLVAGLVLLALTGVWLGVRAIGDRRALWFAVALSLPLLLVFKRGFVRQDGHVYTFFCSLAALIGLLLVTTRTRRDVAVGAALAVVTIAIGAAAEARDHALTGPDALRRVAGYQGATTLVDWLSAHPPNPAALASDALPAEWVAMIRSEGAGVVGVLPYELNIAPANGLTLRPNRTLQSYAAFTRRLDAWEAEHFVSERAPAFVVVEWKNVDYRNFYVDTPATWHAVLCWYDARASVEGRTLLVRRPLPKPLVEFEARDQTARVGEWVDVPDSDGVIEVAIEAPLSLEGRLLRAFYRLPYVTLEWQYEDGSEARVVAVVDTLANGLAVNRLPRHLGDLTALFRGERTPRVTRFRLSGDGAGLYGPELRLSWRPSIALAAR